MFSIGLRTKLLLAVLPLFAIPVVGLGYVREMEALLKEQQEQNLITAARTIATALHDRPSLLKLRPEDPVLKREREEALKAFAPDPATAASSGSVVTAPDLAATDAPAVVNPVSRPQQPMVIATEATVEAPPATDEVGKIISGLGRARSRVWVIDKKHQLLALAGSLKAVPDSNNGPGAAPKPPPSLWDQTENRVLRPLYARLLSPPTEDFDEALPEDAIANGAEVERALTGIPATRRRATTDNRAVILSAAHPIWADKDVVAAVVVEETTNSVQSFTTRTLEKLITGTLLTFFLAALVLLIFASRIAGRVTRLRNEAEAAIVANGPEVERALTGIGATRRRATPDNRAVILSAAHPIWADKDVVAAVVVEETTNSVQSFTTRTLEKLITGTLLTFFLAALVLLIFASRIAGRVTRLRNEAEAAIDANGRVRTIVAGSRSGDELGDLSRSFSELLERLAQYHDYLEQLGSRLSHEFRTPITVVRSSLDNLKMHGLPADAAVYVQRAEQGVSRLSAMLARMSEARRIEAALREGERTEYDPREVVAGSVEGYRAAYPGVAFETRFTDEPLQVSGSPELLAQALDKLVANAVSFAAPDTPVRIGLRRDGSDALIEVENSGPTLPDVHSARLFDSMVSLRESGADTAEPHLGLGLFIVRLVAEFHGGSADGHNRADSSGVVMRMRLRAASETGIFPAR